VEPFTIAVADDVLDDLRRRLRGTRWPCASPAEPWEQGVDLDYLRGLVAYWGDGFDWRPQEAALNRFQHFRMTVDGVRIHFVHERARNGSGIPLVLTHGWPSAFTEMLGLVPLLTDPAAHGIDGPSFDVVIPSLPGYAFSERPARTGVNYRYVAGLWHELMRALGYSRYGVQGTDFGSGVSAMMALDDPAPVIGVHLTNLDIWPVLGPTPALSAAEQAYLAHNEKFWLRERGYKEIQATKPQTLGYGLSDSPAGLAAWIVEKWRTWADSQGDPDARFGRDFLLTLLTIYWATNTITPSIRDYYDNRYHAVELGPADFIDVPTAYAGFTNEFSPEGVPPREFVERLYRIERWTPMPRGGHFAAAEEPELLARDISAFFGGLASALG
jgi:pimeloyl-ACP methyl ester carboxylesterase